mgnify:FL=1
MGYFYPRPPRGGRHGQPLQIVECDLISIHALREEGDLSGFSRVYLLSYFYPRPPRGGRLLYEADLTIRWLFLSTPSARRATVPDVEELVIPDISIHALREEGDPTSGGLQKASY